MADAQESKTEQPAPEKKRKWLWFLIKAVLGLVVLLGLFAGGIFVGPKIGAKLRVPGYSVAVAPPVEEDVPIGPTHTIDPVIVDVKDSDGGLHHVKVGIAVELDKDIKEEDFEKYVPRARDAAILYLRSLSFDKVTKTDEFEGIRQELGKRVLAALGEKRAKKVLFTDFVVQ